MFEHRPHPRSLWSNNTDLCEIDDSSGIFPGARCTQTTINNRVDNTQCGMDNPQYDRVVDDAGGPLLLVEC